MADIVGGNGASPFGAWSPAGANSFNDPFNDLSSLAIPETMAYALRWCEYIFFANGIYRQAVDRVLSYFITDIEVSSLLQDQDLNDDEKNKYEAFFKDTLGVYKLLHIVGLDYMCYGNSFTSVLVPFRRYLFCPECYLELPLREVYSKPVFQFRWADYEFNATCPKCKYSGVWGHVDRKGNDEDIKIKRWNPHEIELLWDPITDDCSYIWKIPPEYRKMIREGHLYHLERSPWEVVQAIKHGNHLRFADDFIYHLKEECLAGIRNRGWGISRVLTNFRQVYYVQVLHRYNEALALDYVIPFRVITPTPQGGAGSDASSRDPILNQNMGGVVAKINAMLRQRRRDPASWFTLPFPIQYQALGGDASKLAPSELLNQGIEVLLNNVGVPTELFKGTLQIQAAPAALRLFESTWSHLVPSLNRFLAFIVRKLADQLSWSPVVVKLMRVTHADDLNRQMAKLQLMMGKQVSQTTGLKSVGLEFKEETRKLMEEERFTAEQQSKLQEDMDQMGQMQQMAQPPQPGDPNAAGGAGQQQQAPQDPNAAPMQQAGQSAMADMPVGPNTSITPQELLARADIKAKQLLGMNDSQRQSELIKLKQSDPTLHPLVKAKIDSYRQQAQTAGGAMMLQQQFGGK